MDFITPVDDIDFQKTAKFLGSESSHERFFCKIGLILRAVTLSPLATALWPNIRSLTTTAASLYGVKPKALLFSLFSLYHPRLLFPSGAKVKAFLGCWLSFNLRMWPMNCPPTLVADFSLLIVNAEGQMRQGL